MLGKKTMEGETLKSWRLYRPKETFVAPAITAVGHFTVTTVARPWTFQSPWTSAACCSSCGRSVDPSVVRGWIRKRP